jgi:hypothetical protein
MIFGTSLVNGALRRQTPRSGRKEWPGAPRCWRLAEQLVESIPQLVLMIRFCQPRQIELGSLGDLGITGRRSPRPHGGASKASPYSLLKPAINSAAGTLRRDIRPNAAGRQSTESG